jgi:hypothetical protein
MATYRNSSFITGYSPTGRKQVDLATPMDPDDLSSGLPIALANRRRFKIDRTTEEIYSCSGEDLIDLLLTGRIGQLPITMDFSPSIAAPFIDYAMGVYVGPVGAGAPYTHTFKRIPGHQPPPFGLTFNNTESGRSLLLKLCVVDNFSIQSQARQKVTMDMLIRFSGATELLVGYTIPDCHDQNVLRFGDCELAVNGVGLSAANLLRSFRFSYSNGLLVQDHPWVGAGVDISRLERATLRQSGFNYALLGDETDPRWIDAEAYAKRSHVLTLGDADDNVVINAPEAIMDHDGDDIAFQGEANETHVLINARPRLVTGNANSPLTAIAHNSQSVAYLVNSGT